MQRLARNRLDGGVLRDDGLHFLETMGVIALLSEVDGRATQWELIPCVQAILLYKEVEIIAGPENRFSAEGLKDLKQL